MGSGRLDKWPDSAPTIPNAGIGEGSTAAPAELQLASISQSAETPDKARATLEEHLSDFERDPVDSPYTLTRIMQDITDAGQLGVDVSGYARRLREIAPGVIKARIEGRLSHLEKNPLTSPYSLADIESLSALAASLKLDVSDYVKRLKILAPIIATKRVEDQLSHLEKNPDSFVYSPLSIKAEIAAARSLGVDVSGYVKRLEILTPIVATKRLENNLSHLEQNPEDSPYTLTRIMQDITDAGQLGVDVSGYARRLREIAPGVIKARIEGRLSHLEKNPDSFVYSSLSIKAEIAAARSLGVDVSGYVKRLEILTPIVATKRLENNLSHLEQNPVSSPYSLSSITEDIVAVGRLGVDVSSYAARLKTLSPIVATERLENNLSHLEQNLKHSPYTPDSVADDIGLARSFGVDVSEYVKRLEAIKTLLDPKKPLTDI